MSQITPPKRLKQSRVQLTVTFTTEEAAAAEQKAIEKLGESIRIEGFRPGRAPADMLRQKISASDLTDETIRLLLPEVFQTILREHALQPIIPPAVNLTSRAPLTLDLIFVERPEVKVKGADKIRVPKKESTLGAADVDRMVEYLRSQYKTTKPVDRASKETDEITLDFVGMADGKEVEGTRAAGYRLTLGSKSLIPGFEEALVGLKKGDTKSFPVTFPADYHAKHLQGKPVTFEATIHGVEETQLPDFTDDFIKEHQLGESHKELRERIETSLKQQEDQADRSRREQELFEAIRAATVIDLAPELLTQEERTIAEEIARGLEREKASLTDWLARTNRTMEKFQQELREEALKRLTLRFAIQWLMEEKKIDASPEEIAAARAQVLEDVPDAERAKAEAFYREGGDGYEELKWRKRVEKLIEGMLAQ